jgi:hypothetical protein
MTLKVEPVTQLGMSGVFLVKNGQYMYLSFEEADEVVNLLYAALPKGSRMDIIGQNGNEGLHYE